MASTWHGSEAGAGDDVADNASTWGGDKPTTNGATVKHDDDFFDSAQTGDNGGFGDDQGGDRPRAPPGACRKCNEEGHFAAECPTQKCNSCGQIGHSAGKCPTPKCNNCGEEGHISFDCEKKSCNFCGEDGHYAKDCESKKNAPCRNCGEEGHRAFECTNPRKLHESGLVEGISEEDIEKAWKLLKDASDAKDLDNFKTAFFEYIKIQPTTTLHDLQTAFKADNMAYNLVAVKKDISNTQTIVDLQGNLDKEFVVTFQSSLKGRRSIFAATAAGRFPETDEENFDRLLNAGFVRESYHQFCTNCNERGHGTRTCPQEQVPREKEAPTLKCVNCGQEGHRSRDCTEERKKRISKTACRNCLEEGHQAADCEKPRDASNVTCRKCEQMGHFSRDCPTAPKMTCRNCDEEGHRAAECPNPRKVTCNNCGQEGHMRVDCTEPRKVICNNCDEEGHMVRDCPKPRDPAKMKCRNCDQMGHSARECKEPRDMNKVKCNECNEMGHFSRGCPNKGKGGDDAGEDSWGGGSGGGSGGGAHNDTATTASGGWDKGDTYGSGW